MHPCLIIAEAGVNHNGQADLAFDLVAAAARAGADIVKFQTFRADRLVTQDAPTAAYQQENTGTTSQFEMLKSLELSPEIHYELFAECQRLGIEFLSTAFDEDLLDFLVAVGIRRIKIPSGELTNIPFVRHAARKNLPMILSTGMADLEEVSETVQVIAETRQLCGFHEPLSSRLTLLHCTSNYPAHFSNVNLKAMLKMQEVFGLPIGYSDHTPGIIVPLAAAALGISVLEKHFTLDRELPGPDHKASLEPQELRAMVAGMRAVEASMGDGNKIATEEEIPVRQLVRRSLVLRRAKPLGSPLTEEDLHCLRPANGIAPKHLTALVGQRLRRDLPAGTVLQWEDIEGP